MKRKIFAGDSAVFTETVHPLIEDPETVQLVLRGPVTVTLDGETVSRGHYRFALSSAVSAGMIPGLYTKILVMATENERASSQLGFLDVQPDPVNAESFDGRTEAQKALADVEKALFSFKQSGGRVKQYTIGSRQMVFADISELLALRDRLMAKVMSECPDGDPRIRLVRFR